MTVSPDGAGQQAGGYDPAPMQPLTGDDEAYDSELDTLKHSRRVDELLMIVTMAIQKRMLCHDESKLHPPEKETFDRVTPRLRESTYGSDEYKGFLADMGEALDHHYASNRHHPEHFENGVSGMTLVDLVEMLCDWKAATERHETGDLAASLAIQRDRFDLGDQLYEILANTAKLAGWLPEDSGAA